MDFLTRRERGLLTFEAVGLLDVHLDGRSECPYCERVLGATSQNDPPPHLDTGPGASQPLPVPCPLLPSH